MKHLLLMFTWFDARESKPLTANLNHLNGPRRTWRLGYQAVQWRPQFGIHSGRPAAAGQQYKKAGRRAGGEGHMAVKPNCINFWKMTAA
jgi:hypothetical protein